MRQMTRLTGGLIVVALVAGSAVPASARGWGSPSRHHRHHNDRGDVVGTIAAVGVVAVLAAALASSSARKREERRIDPPPPAPRDEAGADWRDEDARYDGRAGAPGQDAAFGRSEEDEAVDACALAARDKATVEAGFGEVRGIDSVRTLGNGWEVSGTLVARQSYRGQGHLRDFQCAFQDGRVDSVALN